MSGCLHNIKSVLSKKRYSCRFRCIEVFGCDQISAWLGLVDAVGTCSEKATNTARNAPVRNAKVSLRVLSRLDHANNEKPKAVLKKSSRNFAKLLGNNIPELPFAPIYGSVDRQTLPGLYFDLPDPNFGSAGADTSVIPR